MLWGEVGHPLPRSTHLVGLSLCLELVLCPLNLGSKRADFLLQPSHLLPLIHSSGLLEGVCVGGGGGGGGEQRKQCNPH